MTACNGRQPPMLPPADWRARAVALLECPGLEPEDAQAIRAWIAWRALPARYWQKLRAIADRIGRTDLA